MGFLDYMRQIAIANLSGGCNAQSMNAIIGLLRYFGYQTLAETLILNIKGNQYGKFFCDAQIISRVFEEYNG